MAETERVTVRLPRDVMEKLQSLVDQGKYANKSDAIRAAIEQFLATEIKPPHVERLTVELPRRNMEKLEELVRAGDYVSIDDAIREAIREYTRMKIRSMIEEYEQLKLVKGQPGGEGPGEGGEEKTGEAEAGKESEPT